MIETGRKPERTGEKKRRGALFFVLLILCSAAPHGLGALLLAAGGPVSVYLLIPYLLILPGAAVLPFLCGRAGLHPLAVFFEEGLGLLISPVYPGYGGIAAVCFVISIFAAAAGNELDKRKKPASAHRGRHGGKGAGRRR